MILADASAVWESFGRQAGNHLWQSTVFAAVAALLALALRKNQARTRYWLWMAASVKFLVPFAGIAAVAGWVGSWIIPAAPVANIPALAARISEPFVMTDVVSATQATVSQAPHTILALLPGVLLAVWFCGFAIIVSKWLRCWRRVSADVRASELVREGREWQALRRLGLGKRIKMVSSPGATEPGIFGIWRPVLWLPAGIGDHLSDAQLEAILAHELCHVRRRDNLAAVTQMAVEAIFWFYPLVWWLGAWLVKEREAACDEEVLGMGIEPQEYAEGILNVCRFFLESPLACVAGVTGADLRKRIEGIMTSQVMRKLSSTKKLVLTAAAVMAIAGPIAIGVLNPQRSRAQSQAGKATPQFEVASVKRQPWPENGGSVGIFIRGNTFDAEHVSVFGLVTFAYNMRDVQVSGGPAWVRRGILLNSELYQVLAKAPGETAPPKEVFRQMLQALLADRFKLQVHRGQKELDIYNLVVDKGGPEMKTSTADVHSDFLASSIGRSGVRIKATHMTMQELIDNQLSAYKDRPIFDKTGLTASYDFTLEFSVRDVADTGPPGQEASIDAPPPLAAAVRRLGLELEPGKAMFDTIIIDHVERPTAN